MMMSSDENMRLTVLKTKLHRAVVTQCDLNYEGSITIDRDLMDQAGLFPFEQVDVLNVNNGQRFTTYVIEGIAGSGIIGVNGAAARLCHHGDPVIICSYGQIEQKHAREYQPTVIQMNPDNTVKSVLGRAELNDNRKCAC